MKKKILLIRLTALGDVIFTLPLVNCLKDNDYEVDYLVSEKGIGVIKNNPSVNKVYFCPLAKWRKNPFSFNNIKEFWQLVFKLRREKYDIALDCQQMWKSLWLFAFCGAKRRITFSDAKELSKFAGNEWVKPKYHFKDNNYHIVERNLDFARHLGLDAMSLKFSLPPLSDETKSKVDELLKKIDERPIVVIAPATTWANKHWDNDNWKKLIEQIKDRYNLVFTGMKGDEFLITELGGYNFLNLAGKTDLNELREVLSRAKVVITPDSGTAHLAWASQKPSVITLFTCTPAKRFGPYGEKYFSISGNTDCQSCFKRKCRFKTNECCKNPKIEAVLEILNSIL